MIKYKNFYAINNIVHGSMDFLEDRINNFLGNNTNIEILKFIQSSSGRLDHHTTVSILYKVV